MSSVTPKDLIDLINAEFVGGQVREEDRLAGATTRSEIIRARFVDGWIEIDLAWTALRDFDSPQHRLLEEAAHYAFPLESVEIDRISPRTGSVTLSVVSGMRMMLWLMKPDDQRLIKKPTV